MTRYGTTYENYKRGGGSVIYHGPLPGKHKHKSKKKTKTEKKPQSEADIFKKAGCKHQFPDCPDKPSEYERQCRHCPFYPKQFKK